MMLTELNRISTQMLLQLKELVKLISDDDYSKPLDLLSGNTIAKHIRHVLEIYDELVIGYDKAIVDYDARKRNTLIEQSREYTLQFINELKYNLNALQVDKHLLLNVSYTTDMKGVQVQTTVSRELAYNIEHAVHHMAIMQIAVKQAFSYIQLDANFGVAFSTQTYLENNVHANIHSK